MKFNQIFVVDDDKIHHFMIKKLLQNNQIEVNPSFFENGFDAINGLKNCINNGEKLPDLILLDINMPILDGWQFLEEYIKLKDRLEKDIAIYIISSSDNTVDVDRAKDFKSEISDYYLKPVTVEAIKSIFSV